MKEKNHNFSRKKMFRIQCVLFVFFLVPLDISVFIMWKSTLTRGTFLGLIICMVLVFLYEKPLNPNRSFSTFIHEWSHWTTAKKLGYNARFYENYTYIEGEIKNRHFKLIAIMPLIVQLSIVGLLSAFLVNIHICFLLILGYSAFSAMSSATKDVMMFFLAFKYPKHTKFKVHEDDKSFTAIW
ncbi:DUF3267 domain-containing protein [Robertmurraya yapensis]|uniref:DUF3267 domain-containing protein n=1 Tax=Bacillus yapensis TaxID=2492960 RepID=A0A431VY16_9BACI|nr:metalloprotease family protein [Bacillus yapensis]RTR28088.1 DUF3267 domain-containing protein [Bacillus yapensis]TKS94330.1 DUF3267 domain-containing protein [Bacillus yapensis]